MISVKTLKDMKPRLVQRCTINKQGNTLRYEYMGSSEFECGDQAKSLKRMFEKGIALAVQPLNVFDNDISVFIVASSGFDFVQYLEVIKGLIKEEWPMQEPTHIDIVVKKLLGIKDGWGFAVDTDSWFDFVNDALFTFSNEKITQLVDILVEHQKEMGGTGFTRDSEI